MDAFFAPDDDENPYKKLVRGNPRETTIQIIISAALGLTAFLTFCFLRPRWPGLYAARKKQKNEATALPELPSSFFGWIMPLWRITDQQVLASAGLDAYAFLAFFKMAMKFLVVTFFFSLIIIKPVHDANPENPKDGDGKDGHDDSSKDILSFNNPMQLLDKDGKLPSLPEYFETDYLWMYVVFTYLFSALAIYLIWTETRRIIEVRQEYLGTQTSVTDRTIRLSGIPPDLQEEVKIKEFIESLDIGKVESVTICRKWKELDDAVAERMNTLRRLEEAYTIHLGYRRVERNLESLPISQPEPPSPRAQNVLEADEEQNESSSLLAANGQQLIRPYERARPKTSIRYGFMGLRSYQVDAIDHYEEKLKQADERVIELRKKEFAPTPLAFVTLDSVAACQMAMQAVLDPSPRHLIANQSPAPIDVIWNNTYLSRRSRMTRSWTITSLIVLSTLLFSVAFVPAAFLLNLDNIAKLSKPFAEFLVDHKNFKSLINAQLPTLLVSLLVVLGPYLYYWMSWYQGTISQGDVELSAISKNYFFTFFNFFVVFTIFGTASNFNKFFEQFGDALRDFSKYGRIIAKSLEQMLNFYVNLIILQGLGLFPFRLLQVGSVSMYPVMRIGAKTPRDYAELVQPPMFNYGFYLPTALLVFTICMVYSVLRSSWQILLAGLVYFAFGHFVYKYQLLYAMDHSQQSTGRQWVMICDRIFVGLVTFQIAIFGELVLEKAFPRSGLLLPLVIITIWISIAYGRTFKPLMKFIALRSVRLGEQYRDYESPPEANSVSSTELAPERNAWANEGSRERYYRETRTANGQAVDESSETGLRYINPSLVAPLEGVWIADKDFRREDAGTSGQLVDTDETV